MKTEFFRFRLTPQHLGKIKSIAEVFGTTEANVLRNLIEHAEVKSLPVVSASLELPAKKKSAQVLADIGAFAN